MQEIESIIFSTERSIPDGMQFSPALLPAKQAGAECMCLLYSTPADTKKIIVSKK